MNDTWDFFVSTRPAFPWSISGIGLPALIAVAAGLIFLTLWTYAGHPRAGRGRILTVTTLRLLALIVALLTALRPSIGIQEEPKVPSHLLIGIDLSESMTIQDEFGNLSRIDAVRKILQKAEGTIEALRDEQNVNVQFYAYGSPDFAEATGAYAAELTADGKRSDYGAYLLRTFERWQGERYVRAHLLIGDGADNGTAYSAIAEANKWRGTSTLHTFAVGSTGTPTSSRDVAITDVVLDPNPVAIKNDLTLRARVNAYGFAGANVNMKVQFDTGDGYQDVAIDKVQLSKEKDNAIEIALKAPEAPGQIKVRVEIPMSEVPGDVSPSNNVVETYLSVTKEGLRVLLVDRFRYEYALILDALATDPRIDVRKVDLQTAETSPGLRAAFDFEENVYDVLVIGNVTARQIEAIDPELPEKIRQQVLKKGMGLLFIGGHATLSGSPKIPDATGWRGTKPIEDILPVTLDNGPPGVAPDVFNRADSKYQFIPNPRLADSYILQLGDTTRQTLELWNRLNERNSKSRFSGLSNIGSPKPTAEVYAWTSNLPELVDPERVRNLAPLLVGHQIGDGNRGRVLTFGAMDTMLWQRLGLPDSTDGINIHSRFWRQLILWLAHQEEEAGSAFARPEFPRLPVGAKQGIRVGLRGKNGAVVIDPKFEVKIIAPGETEANAKTSPVVADPNGGSRVNTNPDLPGEYTVKVVASGKTAAGEDVEGEATAKYLVYPEASDEMIRTAADHEYLQKLSNSGGGQFYRLEDLPAFLEELKGQPLDSVKPKPRYIPDWRRDHSQGFLPIWFVVFVILLGTEWGLRRLWGMV